MLNLSLDDELLIQIDDDGPGVDAQQFEKMQTRGIRIDEQGDGHGLGLAIVNDLIQDYQGSILFSSSDELGGLKVSVRLPLPG